MIRGTPIALFLLLALGGMSRAGAADCCGHCGCKLDCQVMCEWKTCKVRRYKVAHEECPPSGCKCCNDRWLLGCPKPIKIMCLQPYEEDKKYLVGRYVVRTCPQCQTESMEALPDSADPPPPSPPSPPPPPAAPKTAKAVISDAEKSAASRFPAFSAFLSRR